MNAGKWLSVVLVVGTLMPGLSMAGEPKSAAEAVKKGGQLLASGDADGAIAAYTKAIRLDPKNDGAYCDRGCCLRPYGQSSTRPSPISPRPLKLTRS